MDERKWERKESGRKTEIMDEIKWERKELGKCNRIKYKRWNNRDKPTQPDTQITAVTNFSSAFLYLHKPRAVDSSIRHLNT
jgi:hypothetical protein